jgi:NTE family protein
MYRLVIAVLLVLALPSCATIDNLPANVATADPNAGLTDQVVEGAAFGDDKIIGLAFSGGGTRAAAFSFGVLKGLGDLNTTDKGRTVSLIDRVDFVSGVSGGSITAAYFGLKKRAALADFRERFLIKDAEAALNTQVSLVNLARGLGGGVNDDLRLRNWLDANLFDGAKFSALTADSRPVVWINATDIYNRTPFVFSKVLFSLICSDLGAYPVSAAVAASAAVPIAFEPVILETYPDRCKPTAPSWLLKAQSNPKASPLLRAFAQGALRQRDGSMKYIKLLDGGLVDNYGLSGFTIARESAETPYGPLTPGEAVRLRRMMFLIVDAGGQAKRDWAQKLEGPSGAALIAAITDSSLDAAKRLSYSAFEATMENWRSAMVRWRCGLTPATVTKLRGPGPWNCRDVQFFIGRIGFDQLDQPLMEKLNAVPTTLKLPEATVDELIAAGSEAVTQNQAYRKFLAGP